MYKKGVVLLITIAMIAVMTPLVLLSMRQAKSSLEDVEKERFVALGSVLLKDVADALKNRTKDIKTNDDLDLILDSVISWDIEDVTVNVETVSYLDKVDINDLYFGGKKDENLSGFVTNLASMYELSDGEYLLNLLLDTIDEDDRERSAFSEIVLKDRDFRNGRITGKEHLKVILEQYFSYTNDENIFKIPWEKLINFGSKEKRNIIDCSRMSKILFDALGFVGDYENRCETVKEPENLDKALALHVKPFAKDLEYFIKCDVQLIKDKISRKYIFLYDVNNQKIVNLKRERL